ncbi:MAG: ComF family protein [bacterium]|nr:ComF family protein [bacterium]
MIKQFLLDLIFPRFCLGCQKELNSKQVSFICETCLNNIVLNSGVQCHVCGLRNANGTYRHCRKKTFLSGLFAAGQYQDPILREAIHQFKYQSAESLKKPLAELMIKYLKKENLLEGLSNSILVPIPLNWRRKLSRGFNQSELLAKELSPVLNCPVVNLLKRQKFSAPQARIKDWKQRKENISGAFEVQISPKSDFEIPRSRTFSLREISRRETNSKVGLRELPKKIILVDDVSTSGATLEEAARVLKQAGFREIYGLVIAKG